jgi:hypothetical protein
MEIVLLWLDDLDDFVCALVALWAGMRRLCLQVGLLAACSLAACEASMTAAAWLPMLAGVAAASVALWLAGAPLVLLARRLRSPPALARG